MSRNTVKRKEASSPGKRSASARGQISQGEGFPTGSRYVTVLNERENKSIQRNNAAQGRPSANTGMISNVGMGARKTGKVG